MIPVSLTVQGIYSYQQQVHIDFQKLLDGRLFGIFGPVGSGKSTILEAISFALYGETERLNKSDKRSYNMMNLRSNALFIDFIFKAGKAENYYRFIVRGKRNKKQFEKTGQFERQGYRWQNQEWQPLDSNDASSIIGLSYENFRRTIIIPQGKFQEFLELGDKDRTKMLKEIFQLDRFELFENAAALERKSLDKETHLKGQYTKYEHLEEEEVSRKEKILNEYNQNIEEAQKKLTEKQKTQNQLTQLKELFEKIRRQKELIHQLKSREPEIQEKEKNLQIFENCYRQFQHDLNRLDEIQNNLENETTTLQQNKKRYNELNQTITEKETRFEELKKAYQEKPQLENQIEDLQTLAKIKNLEEEIAGQEERVEKGNNYYKEISQQVENNKAQYKKLLNEVKDLKQKLPDTTQLAAVNEWFTQKKHLKEYQENYQKELHQINQAIEKIEHQKKQTLTEQIPMEEANNWNLQPIEAIISYLTNQISGKEAELEQLDKELQHLRIQETLESYARDLKEGKPCPVCGATEHPDLLQGENITQNLTKANQQREKLNNDLKGYNAAYQHLQKLGGQLEDKKSWQEKYKEELEKLNRQWQSHFEQFQWTDFDPENEQALREAWNQADELKNQLDNREKQVDELYQTLEKEQQQQQKAQERLQSLNQEITEKQTTRKNYIDGLKILSYNDYQQKEEKELEKQAEVLKSNVAQTEKEYQEMEIWLRENRKTRDTLDGQISTQQKNIEVYQQRLSEVQEKIDQKLSESDFSSIEEIRKILASPMDIENTREEIRKFKQDLHSATNYLQKLEEETQGQTFDPEQLNKINEEVNELSEKLEQLKEAKTNTESALNQLREDLKIKKDLEQQLEAVEARLEKIRLIKKLFQGSGFVNYISSVYLQNLCNAANDRFYKLTRQKMRLELTENNNFQIRDFLNDGQVRSIKTLSGGQLFQASLSLALALAESIQQQNELKQNFFFLDEGFGSQDKHSLQLVFETLKSLRKENRMVGIISHVEELQEEIDVHLRVENDEEEGSKVKASWEIG